MSDHEDVDMGGMSAPSNARQLKDTQNDLSDDDEMGPSNGTAAAAASLTDFPAPLQIDKGKGKLEDQDASALDNLPWVEKYRPATLDDVVAHGSIVSTIEKFISLNRLPHLLFYGPPGTGKTSTILAVARKLYPTAQSFRNNVLELNASDERGIDVVREQIKSFAGTRMVFHQKGQTQFKLIILDEADMMTQAAQGALRRVIEQYTTNARFCIICNYVNRIIPAIQSRCTKFRFAPLPESEVERRINHVVAAESANLSEDGRRALMKLSRGDMRRALNVLQACHAAYDLTDETAIYNCTGNPHPSDIQDIVQSMMSEEFQVAVKRIGAMKSEKGLALQDIIQGIFEFVHTVELPSPARMYLLDHMARVEHRLSTGGSEKLQLTSLLGAFKGAVEIAARGEPKKLT